MNGASLPSEAHECVALLRWIVSAWPATVRPNVDRAIFERVIGALATDFPESAFILNPRGVAEVHAIEAMPLSVRIDFEGEDAGTYRAMFIKAIDDGWRLADLTFECPGCFGSGTNDSVTCELCGGAGWGVA